MRAVLERNRRRRDGDCSGKQSTFNRSSTLMGDFLAICCKWRAA